MPRQILLNALVAGHVYALVAIGFTLVYRLTRILHLAHAGVYALGAYIWYALILAGFEPAMAALSACAASGIVGMCTYFCVYRPLRLRGGGELTMLLASLALYILLENVIVLVWGAESRYPPVATGHASREFLGFLITDVRMTIVGVVLLLFGLVAMVLRLTPHGKAARAIASNTELARLSGIPTARLTAATFVASSVMAATAGILVAADTQLTPSMGFTALVYGFSAAIVGGLRRTSGAIGGGLLMGLVQNAAAWFLGSLWQQAIGFAALAAVILLRGSVIQRRDASLGAML